MPSARGIVIEVIGDDRSALRMWERQLAASETTGKAYKKFALTAQETAAVQVQAALKAEAAQKAQITGLRALAASSVAGSPQQIKALALADAATLSLARSQGQAAASSHRFSAGVKEGEKDLNKIVRGGLAGAGVFASLGRSLAFASSGFIAFAIAAGVIRDSIDAARELAIKQRQVNQQLKVSGKSWDDYSAQVDKATIHLSHLSGFTHVDLLNSFGFIVRATGEVGKSLRLMGIAADVARGRGISLQAATIALTKAVGGSSTALRRLGIIVPATAKGMDAINFVATKFAGQAKAGASAADRFHATLVDTEEIIGQALLPILNKAVVSLGNWLAKMNESGQLEKNVNSVVGGTVDVFKALGAIIGTVDKVTGGFKRTLEILIALRFAKIVAGWVGALDLLTARWIAVDGAATAAGAAQATALSTGALGAAGSARGAARGIGAVEAGAGGLAIGAAIRSRLQQRRLTQNLPLVFGQYTRAAERTLPATAKATSALTKLSSNIGLLGIAAVIALPRLQKLGERESGIVGSSLGTKARNVFDVALNFAGGGALGKNPFDILFGKDKKPIDVPVKLIPAPGFENLFKPGGGITGPFGAARIQKQFTQRFDLKPLEQLAQARAALSRSTRDDVAAARQVLARVRRAIDEGRVHGQALIQALGLEASALSTIWSAEDEIAQKRAAAAQAAKARAEAQFANLVDPLKLEVALLRAEASGASILPILRKLLASARKALSQARGLKQQQQALEQIVAVQQQIKDAAQNSTVQFQIPAKLAFRLARDTALGRSTTKDLLAIRRAILRFIATHKHNLQALTDAYNQLADINQQIGATAQSALGLFRQASTRALTEGLGLTDEQRKQLRARLSQVGPGGTIPGEGVGAGGFAINPDTGRPIHVHTRIDIDGTKVAENTTKHQQRHKRRNSRQRRGPNAGG